MVKPGGPNLGIAQELQLKGRDELLSDLKNMVNNREESDVGFKCNDGICVHACRLLLASRNAVFKSMLSNGMLETNLSEIPMKNYSSSVFRCVVEFLYMGTVESCLPLTWKMGFELISAAQFFMIPTLQLIAQDSLLNHASEAVTSQQSTLMDMLSIAVDFQETWEGKDTMLLGLIRHTGHDWSGASFLKLSRSAMDYIRRKSKGSFRETEDEPYLDGCHTISCHEHPNFLCKLVYDHQDDGQISCCCPTIPNPKKL